MTLKRRISTLEARRVFPEIESGIMRARLSSMLARLEAAIVASGSAADCPGASPIERTVRRYLRGDAEPGQAIRDALERRFP